MTAEKARIVESEEIAVARQRLSKIVTLATHTHATIEQLLETVLPMRYMQRLYQEGF
jgi:hypothetical protein